jgi:hypothetical protein
MSAPSPIERVKTSLVGLKMPRALEVLDITLRSIERGEIGAVEAIDALLTDAREPARQEGGSDGKVLGDQDPASTSPSSRSPDWGIFRRHFSGKSRRH